MSRQSAIYHGRVRHRRHRPVEHVFENRLFMVYLDLDELPELFDGIPFWSCRRAWRRGLRRLIFPSLPPRRSNRPCIRLSILSKRQRRSKST